MDFVGLIDWYEAAHRELPWRETQDPYRICLSEVILQQTRVAQGWAYYTRFVDRFPTVRELAAAEEDEVLKLWQGLGYYSRARNLHAAAKQVEERYGGLFPTTYEEVRGLRGVGDYTAAAIVSFAVDAPYAVVDGNVYRVLSRVLDVETPIDSTAGKREFTVAAEALLAEYLALPGNRGAGIYNQAMMELGALVCTPRGAQCEACPLRGNCLARQHATVEERPVKRGKTTQKPRYFNYLHIVDRFGRTVIRRRDGEDIWRGLYEFPLIETSVEVEFETLAIPVSGWVWEGAVRMPKHVLSHRVIHATFHRLTVADLSRMALPEGWMVVPTEKLGEYAVARLTELYLERA